MDPLAWSERGLRIKMGKESKTNPKTRQATEQKMELEATDLHCISEIVLMYLTSNFNSTNTHQRLISLISKVAF